MKWSTELKVLVALLVLAAAYLLYKQLAAVAKKVTDELDPNGSGIGNTVASSLDANIAPAGGVSLNTAIATGMEPNPITDKPWWQSTIDALFGNAALPFSGLDSTPTIQAQP